MLKLYNTLSRQKESFEPLYDDRIGLYVCGPTVYDFAHIGNGRPYVAFDILYRLLSTLYGKTHRVTYARNLTDIDDKIIAASQKNKESIGELTERITDLFLKDMDALNILRPDTQPKATEHVDEMITMITTLVDKGHAYETQGHVCFSVKSMADYGTLSKPNEDALQAGARVEVAAYKKDPFDFVLWKPSTDNQPGWESPWGRGRPGWHIECSAMAQKYLGDVFDIHAGGQDLMFPHHENEIAQSCCANDTNLMAKTWLHNGYVIINGKKMSKSLGNFVTVHDLLEKVHGEVIRTVLMSAHYRQPLDFTDQGLVQAKQNLDRFYGALKGFDVCDAEPHPDMMAALCDDLNTPKALSILHDLANQIYKCEESSEKQNLQATLKASASVMGILTESYDTWCTWAPSSANSIEEAEIEALIEERIQAKKDKNYARSDEIRNTLLDQGIILEDSATGTSWKRK